MSVVDLAVALLGGSLHRFDVISVFLPDTMDEFGDRLLVLGELVDLVDEVQKHRGPGAARIDDSLVGQLLART